MKCPLPKKPVYKAEWLYSNIIAAIYCVIFCCLYGSSFPEWVSAGEQGTQEPFFPSAAVGGYEGFVQSGEPKLLAKASDKKLGDDSFVVLRVKERDAQLTIPHDSSLGLKADSHFIVSFFVYFDAIPPSGVRQNIVRKYDGATRPYPGWAIAFSRYPTSLRPEFYLRGEDGSGGWYSFGSLEAFTGKWLSITFIVRPGEFISCYTQEYPQGIADIEQLREDELTPARFLGGYVLDFASEGTNEQELGYGSLASGSRGFVGMLGPLLIGHLENLDAMPKRVTELHKRGAFSWQKEISKESSGFWLVNGRDQSKFARALRLDGPITWFRLR